MQDYKPNSIYLLQGLFSDEALKKVKFTKGAPVFVCEGRPSLEAGRKVSAALLKRGIVPTMISDNMMGFLFFKGLVKKAVLACQYADKGGALCNIGALIVAVLAKKHKVAVQLMGAKHTGRFLGDPQSVLSFEGIPIAPKGTLGYAPLVEWVPAKYLRKKA